MAWHASRRFVMSALREWINIHFWIRCARPTTVGSQGQDFHRDVGDLADLKKMLIHRGRTSIEMWGTWRTLKNVGSQGQDFHRDVGDLADVLLPQHNYRLDAKSAEGRHYGEVACKEFWESVLRVMPHR